MRTRINVTFTASTRSINTGITDLTIEDIRLIVNETQKRVLCSSMQKDLITSVTNGVVTYVESYQKVMPNGTVQTIVIPVLAAGDHITFEIDRGTSAEDIKSVVDSIKTIVDDNMDDYAAQLADILGDVPDSDDSEDSESVE